MKAPKPIRIVDLREGAETTFVWPDGRQLTFRHKRRRGRMRLELDSGPNAPKILTKRPSSG